MDLPTFLDSNRHRLVATSRIPAEVNTTSFGDWRWELILMAFVILTYTPVWQAGFIWDDDAVLTANPCIVGPLGLKEIWTTSAADICPLVLTTFGIEHALWGLAPLPFHLVNVLMHAACAILLWRVLRSLRVQGGWLGAAFWALHPVEVESVAWITEMKNTESGLFFLLAILFFVRWLRTKDHYGRTGGGWNYGLTLLFAALAMISKSSTVVLPVVLCLCAWWIERRWYWRNLVRVGPLLLMAAAASALSIWTQGLQLATLTDPQWTRTWPERVAAAGDAVWFYLGKLIWPHPLITIYPRWQIDAGQWISCLPLLAVIGVLSIFWLRRDRWSGASFFAFAYFLTTLLPALGLIDNPIFRYSLVFDHFQYLASIGPLALAGAGLARLSDYMLPKKRSLQTTLCVGLLLVLGTTSWQRTRVYANQETLWTDTLVKNPRSWLARNTLGLIYFQQGQLNKAAAQFQKVVEIYPNFADAHCDLGSALFQMGQRDEGVAQFQKALEINPYLAVAHSNLGNALLQKGQLAEAVTQLQKALEINPNLADAHSNLGNALLQEGQLDKAIVQFRQALEIDPSSSATHYSLSSALFQTGQFEATIAELQEVLGLKPDFSPAQDNLARVQALIRQREGP